MNVDDGLEDQVDPWSIAREVARCVVRSSRKPEKKRLFFAIGEGSRIFAACFLPGTQQRLNLFVSDAWPAPATYNRPFCEHCVRPEGGSEPLTSAPRLDFMAQSVVLSIDVCRGFGMSPLRTNIWLSFVQTDLGPRSAQDRT